MLNSSLTPPYIHHWNTAKLNERILISIISLVMLWAFFIHGVAVLIIIGSSFLGALLAAFFVRLVFKTRINTSGFVIWSLLIASIFPISIPLYIPFCTEFVALFLFGSLLGGRENNSYNIPAFASLFAYMAWPYAMTSYAISGTKSGIDIISASTPIQKLTETVSSNLFQKDGFSLLQELGFQISKTDKSITNYLNTVLFNDFKSNLPYGFFDFLFGARGSTIIESGLFIIILGTIILFAFGYYKYITSFLATFVFLSLVFIFGLGLPGEELLHGNVLLALVNHGILPAMLVFGIFPENSCISRWGQLVFGLILGFILYFTLRFKTGSSGVFLSICIANLLMILIKNRRLSLYNAQGNGNEK